MRLGSSSRPYGRLKPGVRFKVKALNLNPSVANVAVDGAGWGPMWTAFDWTGWIKPQIDAAKTLGANTVKITGSGATAAYPSSVTFIAHVRQFLDYCAAKNLHVYWQYGSTDWGGSIAAATTPMQNLCAVLNGYSNVIAVDVANEPGIVGPPLSAVPGLFTLARGVTTLPLASGLSCPGAGNFTDSTASTVAQYADFMDFHPYFSGSDPANSNFTSYRGQSFYKPFLLGECGQNLGAGAGAQASRWTSLGTISAAASDCYGAVGFCMADYDTSSNANRWGVYDQNLANPRSAITTAFSGWPTS